MTTIHQLSQAVAGMSVTPPMPEWFKPSVTDREETITLASRDQSSSWAAYISYTAESGKKSERRIVCRKIEGYGKAETVGAWCCETRAHKRFRIDRINDLICLTTGEVLEPMVHFEMLRLHGVIGVNDKALNDLCKILVFMAKCDGELHPLEADAIEAAIERYVLRFGGDDRVIHAALKRSTQLAPDDRDFVDSLLAVEKHPHAKSVASLLIEQIGEVNAADGVYHQHEMEWSAMASGVLKAMAA